jgi:hypothetical protein
MQQARDKKELRGLSAIEYASQNPGTTLQRRAVVTGRVESITLDVAYWLSQRGADGQIFVTPADAPQVRVATSAAGSEG